MPHAVSASAVQACYAPWAAPSKHTSYMRIYLNYMHMAQRHLALSRQAEAVAAHLGPQIRTTFAARPPAARRGPSHLIKY